MPSKDIEFKDAVELAKFVAQLEREGVTYDVHNGDDMWTVKLTGGF